MANIVQQYIDIAKKRNANEPEFLQTVEEVLTTLEPVLEAHPEYVEAGIIERLIEPERGFVFRVAWIDDNGKCQVNRGFRYEFNSAIGPYKGGLRFHPSVYQGIIKFLGFEQIFKNSLTGLPIGGGKGGSDFNPKGKSENEVMRFCQSFMTELQKYIGADTDVPAGDMGVGGREIGYMYGQYKRLTGKFEGVLTGKGIGWGGSLARTEATGFGVVYYTREMLKANGMDFKGKKVVISGSGNVAIYACEKAQAQGANVIVMSDSNGYVVDEDGIDIEIVKQLKEVERKRIKEYVNRKKGAKYVDTPNPWEVACDIAMPCSTQNDIDIKKAEVLVKNGVKAVGEGANMPCTNEAEQFFLSKNVLVAPAKAANAGGVAVSQLEMAQNAQKEEWTFEKVETKLENIMIEIFKKCDDAAKEYGMEGNYIAGANIAGFLKVAKAMMAQGIV